MLSLILLLLPLLPLLLLLLSQAKLEAVYVNTSPQFGLMVHLELSFPHLLTKHAGAPAAAWMVLHSPPNSSQLHMWAVWQDKTPTRLPESLWLRFKPAKGAVDEDSWLMHKIDSQVSPSEVGARGGRAGGWAEEGESGYRQKGKGRQGGG